MTDSHDGFRDLSAIGDIFKASIAHMKVRCTDIRADYTGKCMKPGQAAFARGLLRQTTLFITFVCSY